MSPTLGVQRAPCLSVCLYIYIYISYVRHFWSRGPRATRKRRPAHLKFKGHMHACCIIGASVSESHLGSSTRPLSVCLSVCLYIYISYVRHFGSRGPRATRKRKPAHLKFKGHMHACCIYTYRASTHVQQLSDTQQRRLEAETTRERGASTAALCSTG